MSFPGWRSLLGRDAPGNSALALCTGALLALLLLLTAHSVAAVVAALMAGVVLAALVRAGVSATVPLLGIPLALVIPTPFMLYAGGRQMPVLIAEVMLAMGVFLCIRRDHSLIPGWWRWSLVALVTWSGLCLALASDLLRGAASFKVVVEAAVIALLVASRPAGRWAPRQPRDLVLWCSLSALAAGVCYTALLAAQGAMSPMTFFAPADAHAIALAHNSSTVLTLAIGRSNYLAALMLLGIIATLAVWPWIPPRRRLQQVVVVAMLASAVGMAATASKAQLLALGWTLGLVAVIRVRGVWGYLRDRGFALGTTAWALTAAGLAPYLAAAFSTLRAALPAKAGAAGHVGGSAVGADPNSVLGEYTSTAGTTGRRIEIWQAAWQSITRHPVFGTGPGNTRLATAVRDYPTTHNVPLQVATETGLAGLVLYAIPFAWLLWRATARARGAIVILVGGIAASGAGEPTLRTGPYDLAAWTILGAWASLVAARPSESDPT